MKRRLLFGGAVILLALATGAFFAGRWGPHELTLTGIVTTNEVVVSPLVGGEVSHLLVSEGDVVKKGERLAVIRPDELRADSSYYHESAEGAKAQVAEGQVALRYQERQTGDQIRQAEAALAAAESHQAEAEADLENARLAFERTEKLAQSGIASAQDLDQARTAHEAAGARLEAARRQADAERASLALAQASAEQVALKRAQLSGDRRELAAAEAQRRKADVRLGYTEVRAPIDGIVDVRAVREGEVVSPGQAVLTLVNPDDLWVRADIEESYIDRIRLGEKLTVRLPSGRELPGTVSYRGVDAGFATQRDVSRTKRDIKTFEVRVRVDNQDRRLALGMTAYVTLPLGD